MPNIMHGVLCLAHGSDGDGIDDGIEIDDGTDPIDFDSDDDGVGDGDEIDLGLDPINPDSDGGGANDGDEIDGGFDPLDPGDDEDCAREPFPGSNGPGADFDDERLVAEPACGCQTTPTAPTGFFGLMLAGLLMVRRRN